MKDKKIRYDLTPQHGINEVSKIFTEKLDKYSINEWKKGLSWCEVLSSLKKHLIQFELGNDYTESGLLQIAEVAANALILCDYYHTFPQGDDRIIQPINKPIVALDLDGVIFDFDKAYREKFGVELNPYWNGHYSMPEHLKELESDKEFWLNLEVLNRPSFEIDCYITSRSIPKEWIEESIQKNNLPCAPVYVVPWNTSKLPLLKELNVNILFDDKFDNYKEATNNGIFCYLVDAPHNRHYNVGHRRIYNLNIPIK